MERDKRYDYVRIMYNGGKIKTLQDIFRYIPKTVYVEDQGLNYSYFTRALNDPGKFKIEQVVKMAEVFGIPPEAMMGMALKELKLLGK